MDFVLFQGVTTELKNTLLHGIKYGEKMINIKEKVSGDFLIIECEVDGRLDSRVKVVMVRM